jgi:FAD/FMN-containing dehydrogenase
MSLPPDLISELKKNLRGSVRTDRASRMLYSTDASIYQVEPLGVVIPRDQSDLHATVELAAKYQVPILPRGSGSSLAGQAVGAALIVDCSRWLDRIIQINPEECKATVEPGVILSALNKALAKSGLQFGPDPASAERATMGGVIGNNATGAHSILYGMTADHIHEAEVILADGSLAVWKEILPPTTGRPGQGRMAVIVSSALEIRERYAQAIKDNYPRSWRNSAGYRLNYLIPWSPSEPPQWVGLRSPELASSYPPIDPSKLNLASLLAGSEGTLAVMRRVTVNLVPRPRQTILAVLAYQSIAAACDDVPRLLNYEPSAIELIPQSIVRLAQSVPAYAAQASMLAVEAEALLIVEFSGDQPQILKNAALALHPTLIAETVEEQVRVWNVRKVGLGLLASRTGDAKTVAFIEDCAIPVERLGEFVRGIERILAEYGVRAEFYAHASAGCLHIRPILDLKRQVGQLRGIAEATLELTLSLGGSMSSEHGDGLARSEWLRRTYGAEVLAAFRNLKRAADPDGILNPGKILDGPPMDANLRFGAGYRAHTWVSALDFSREGGLEGAIEQCNGQGVCRKFDGTMCPSFQATREEMHSTRGRANLLRALISHPVASGSETLLVSQAELQNDAYAALDLCLACKGCKSECPSGVDMAKLKYSFQAE